MKLSDSFGERLGGMKFLSHSSSSAFVATPAISSPSASGSSFFSMAGTGGKSKMQAPLFERLGLSWPLEADSAEVVREVVEEVGEAGGEDDGDEEPEGIFSGAISDAILDEGDEDVVVDKMVTGSEEEKEEDVGVMVAGEGGTTG